MYQCEDCKDTGKITLLSSTVDCGCIKKHGVDSPDLKSHTRESGFLNGWFSKSCALNRGWAVYLDADGNEIKVVEVSIKPMPISAWTDLEFVGVVREWVKTVDKFGQRI